MHPAENDQTSKQVIDSAEQSIRSTKQLIESVVSKMSASKKTDCILFRKTVSKVTINIYMARGIIYVMSTVVPGLVKIGKTGLENFESRMYTLERNGYFNVVGLTRRFAIAVDDYDEKEILLDEIFRKNSAD